MDDAEQKSVLAVTPELLERYDRPGPRYTSYPTAPAWKEDGEGVAYEERLERAGSENPGDPLSLYVHVPYCESLCLYCGCNVVITKNHAVTPAYLSDVGREVARVAKRLGKRRKVSQLHLGGGTPTFLASEELSDLVRSVTDHFELLSDAEVSLEVDPRVTDDHQLETLSHLGFNRVSLGVQDFSEKVQRAVNRVQSEEETRSLIKTARVLGFESVNIDLMYGLPHQSRDDFDHTLDAVLDLHPDRIALFSYAHVPWLKPAQEAFEKKEGVLPDAWEKFEIFRHAWTRFTASGYEQIGMDHFALADDELTKARDRGDLFRNFMGYTVRPATDAIAFGVSSISDVANTYVQNEKDLKQYHEMLASGGLAAVRGCILTDEDVLRRRVIHSLLCNFTLDIRVLEEEVGIVFARHFSRELENLDPFIRDGMVKVTPERIEVTVLGRFFIRNVCMVFDPYLSDLGKTGPIFSRTV